MIAIAKTPLRALDIRENKQFLKMLPWIQSQARRAFCRVPAELREELVAEVVAHAVCSFARLAHCGKTSVAYATPLAGYAIQAVRAGRRVGTKSNARDLTSPTRNYPIESLDTLAFQQGQWCEALVEDRRTTPADIAAARIDVAAWLRSLSRMHRRIATLLARGETGQEVAKQFHVSPARISQIRKCLGDSWERFQGTDVARRPSVAAS